MPIEWVAFRRLPERLQGLVTIFTVPKYGGGAGPAGPSGPTGAAGASAARYFLRYTWGGSTVVPSGGTRFLRLGQGVFSSETADLLTADGTIRGVSITVDQVDASRDFEVRVISDPSGAGGTGPTTEGTLALPVSTLRSRRRDLAAVVSGLLDLGVSIVRTSGAGGSSFNEAVVIVEVSIP